MANFRVRLKKKAKRQSERRPKPPSFRKALFILLPVIIVAVILIPLYLLYAKAPSFTVREVVLMGDTGRSSVNYADLDRMMCDRNIFELNLKDVRSYMLTNYQELRDMKLEKAFPSSIIATAILRKPVAQLYRDRYYPVDTDGVVLSDVRDDPDKRLPIIHGVRFNPARVVGKPTDSRHIEKALLLLKELSDSGILDRHTLVEIDVSSLRNVIFFLEDGLEVKIGREDFAARLDNLKGVLSDPKIKPADIRYIDLRFKEPVIGPKWQR